MRTAVSERSCARARRALSLVLDYEASDEDVRRLAVHLGNCGNCRRFAAEVSSFTRKLRSAPAAWRIDSKRMQRRENGHG